MAPKGPLVILAEFEVRPDAVDRFLELRAERVRQDEEILDAFGDRRDSVCTGMNRVRPRQTATTGDSNMHTGSNRETGSVVMLSKKLRHAGSSASSPGGIQ